MELITKKETIVVYRVDDMRTNYDDHCPEWKKEMIKYNKEAYWKKFIEEIECDELGHEISKTIYSALGKYKITYENEYTDDKRWKKRTVRYDDREWYEVYLYDWIGLVQKFTRYSTDTNEVMYEEEMKYEFSDGLLYSRTTNSESDCVCLEIFDQELRLLKIYRDESDPNSYMRYEYDEYGNCIVEYKYGKKDYYIGEYEYKTYTYEGELKNEWIVRYEKNFWILDMLLNRDYMREWYQSEDFPTEIKIVKERIYW